MREKQEDADSFAICTDYLAILMIFSFLTRWLLSLFHFVNGSILCYYHESQDSRQEDGLMEFSSFIFLLMCCWKDGLMNSFNADCIIKEKHRKLRYFRRFLHLFDDIYLDIQQPFKVISYFFDMIELVSAQQHLN